MLVVRADRDDDETKDGDDGKDASSTVVVATTSDVKSTSAILESRSSQTISDNGKDTTHSATTDAHGMSACDEQAPVLPYSGCVTVSLSVIQVSVGMLLSRFELVNQQ